MCRATHAHRTRKKMWHEAYPDVSFEQVDDIVRNLRKREQEAQQLQQRIEKA